MNNFFATPEGAWGDGSVHLTITGIVIVVVICSCHRTCHGMFRDQIV